jgi:DNA-binding MarR family transcriptional regulator
MNSSRRRAKPVAVGTPGTRTAEAGPGEALWKGYFPHSLSRVMNLLNLRLLEWLRPHGATVQQFRVMQVIAALGMASIGEIAQDTVIEQPVVSRVVDQLEARGFARRRKRPGNGRIVEVTLTPLGTKVFQSVSPHAYAIVREATQVLSSAEKATIEDLLSRIFRHQQVGARTRSNGRAPGAGRDTVKANDLGGRVTRFPPEN